MTIKRRSPANLRLTVPCLLVAVSPAVSAHPGEHGANWLQAVLHLLSWPDHLAAIVLTLIVAAWGLRALLRRR